MPPPILLTTECASELDAHYAAWLKCAKGAAARRQQTMEFAGPLGGAPDTAPVLRVPLKYSPTTSELRKLILQAATTEWLLLRLQRQSDPILNNLFEIEMANWTPAHHRQYQHTQRLLTTAEDQLHRLRLKIWQHRQKRRIHAKQQRQNPCQAAANISRAKPGTCSEFPLQYSAPNRQPRAAGNSVHVPVVSLAPTVHPAPPTCFSTQSQVAG